MLGSLMAWQPHLTIAGCVVSFDTSDSASYTVTGGNTVTSITNRKSGTAWTEGTNPPTYEARALNGQPCMLGDGAADHITSTEAAVVAAFSGADLPFTVIVVADPVTPATSQAFFAVASSAANTARSYTFGTSSSAFVRGDKTDDALATVTAETLAISAGCDVFSFVCPGTTMSIYVSGTREVNAAAFNVGATTPNQASLLCRRDSTPDRFAVARVGAVLAFNSELSASDLSRVHSRLMAQWGIS